MRSFLALSFSLVATLSLAADAVEKPAAAAAGPAMPWKTSYATALKDAESAKKPILFDFHTGWCPHCTRMDKTTWQDTALVELASKSFVVAKINADVEKAPVSRYRLSGFPTVIIAEPGGDQVLRLEGYKDAAAISAALKAYVASADRLTPAFATLRTDKKNADALMVIGSFNARVGLHDQAADSFLKAMKSSTGPALVSASAAAGSSLVKAGKASEAEKALKEGVAAAGDAPTAPLLLALGQCQAAQGRPDAAKAYFSQLQAAFPSSPEAAEAKKALPAPAPAG